MTTLRFDNLQQYSDVLRSQKGEAITVRFVEPRDGEELQNYSSAQPPWIGTFNALLGLKRRFLVSGSTS